MRQGSPSKPNASPFDTHVGVETLGLAGASRLTCQNAVHGVTESAPCMRTWSSVLAFHCVRVSPTSF